MPVLTEQTDPDVKSLTVQISGSATRHNDRWYLPNRSHLSKDASQEEITDADFHVLNQDGGDLLVTLTMATD